MNKKIQTNMKEKLKYEAPTLTAVEFRVERGFAGSLIEFNLNQEIEQQVMSELLTESEFNAGNFTNQDMTSPTGSWVYTQEGTWF